MSEVITNWVLFDATADKPYIKKMMPEGFLAVFDSEEDAKRAKASHKGTDYKRIDRVKASDYDQLNSLLTASKFYGEFVAEFAEELKAERDQLKAENERLVGQSKDDQLHMLKVIAERDTLRKQLDEARDLLETASSGRIDGYDIEQIDAWLERNKE